MIDRIYGAVVEPKNWHGVVRDICRASNAHSGVFALSDNDTELSTVSIAHGVFEDAATVAAYFAHFGAMDIAVPVFARNPTGRFAATSAVFEPRAIAHNEFYNDFFLKLGLSDSAGSNVLRDERGTAMFCMQREKGARPFSAEELRGLDMLAPHLGRALQLHRVFAPVRRAAGAFADVMERVPIGVVLVDQSGRVWHRNAAARALLNRNDGLAVAADGRLSAIERSAEARLARLVGSVLADGGDNPGGRVTVPRGESRADYALLVAPAPAETVSLFEPLTASGAMVLISDPDRSERGELVSAMARYRLTAAELSLLAGLVAGRSLRDYCDENRISINTGKFHLRALFAKTETHGQVGLVRAALIALRGL